MPSSNLSSTFVIDDDELSRELLTLMLEAEGRPTHGFISGEAALTALTDTTPGVILADLQMPGICGNPLAERLRAAAGPATVLLAISARLPDPEAVSAFDGFLLKPFTTAQLLEALANPARPTVRPASRNTADQTGLPVIDQATFRNLAANMKPEQLRQLYQLSLTDAARRTELLRAAAEAGDEATFIREAHSLQGGCGLIGALELRSVALAMESGGLSTAALLPQISAATDRLQRMLDSLPEL